MAADFQQALSIDNDDSATDTLVLGAFTTAGTNRHADVIIGGGSSSAMTVSSVTRTGDTYTHQRSDNNPTESDWANGSFWMSTTEPVTASQSMTVVLSGARSAWGFTYVQLVGVDQDTRISGSVALNPDGDGAVDALVISSAVDDIVVSAILCAEAAPPAPSGGTETSRSTWTMTSQDITGSVATAPGAATVTLDWAASPFRFVHYAVSHPAAPTYTEPTATIDTPVDSGEAVDVQINEGDSVLLASSVSDGEEPFQHSWELDIDGGGFVEFSTVADPGATQFLAPGTNTIRYTVTDNQMNSSSDERTIAVLYVDTSPTIQVPVDTINVDRGVPTLIEDVSVSYATSDDNYLQLSTVNGTVEVTLSGTSVVGGANGSGFLVIFGSAANINSALATLTYTAAVKGAATIDVIAVDDDTQQSNESILLLVANTAPVITSNGGGSTGSVNVAEGETVVTTVTATDEDPADTLTYSIIGGADAVEFSIQSLSGVLSFVGAPDFENPTDADLDNDYEVIVQVSDGTDTDSQTLTVTVTNVAPTAVASSSGEVGVLNVPTQLIGTGSSDPGGGTLTYAWTWVSRPAFSTADFSGAAIANPTFTPDLHGLYIAQLIVNDGLLDSDPDTIEIDADSTISYAYHDTIPLGAVISSDPPAGTLLAPGQVVRLVLSLGPLLKPIPSLAELTQAQSESAITRAQMIVGTVTTAYHATISIGKVISQSPLAGVKVEAATTVDFIVSLGPETVQVPWTLEYLGDDADDALEQVGL